MQHSLDSAVCQPSGEFDASNVGQFRLILDRVSSEPRVVIDLSAVTFIDSSALGALVGAVRRIERHGGRIGIACGRPFLLRLFITVGLDQVVPIAPDVETVTIALGRVGHTETPMDTQV